MQGLIAVPVVKPILGTMTYGGDQTSKQDALEQVQHFTSRGYFEIDTARMYQSGKTENILGDILREVRIGDNKLVVASKVNCFPMYNKSLSPESVRLQSDQILDALQTDRTDILFLHSPDINTKIEDTLEAVQSLFKVNRFVEFGLSNYCAWEVAYIYMYMAQRNYVLPTVYEGMYNAVTRDVEKELFMCLNKFGMRFHAYNPLCGGLLTGKHSQSFEGSAPSPDASSTPFKDGNTSVTTDGTRFDKSNALYRARYWKDEYFRAVEIIKAACDKEGINCGDASIRWMIHHSMLSGSRQDRIIVGASSMSHLRSNLDSCERGPLPESIVRAIDEAWETTRPVCEKYFRP